MTTARTRAKRILPLAAGIGATALLLTGCGPAGNGGGGDDASDPKSFSYLSFAENTSIQDTLTALSEDQCTAENEALPLDISTQPQESYDQQLQLLGGQDSLSSIFASGNSPQLAKDLDKGGLLVDIGAELDALGQGDDLLPAARSTLEALYDGNVYALPTELNVEGIWYNTKIFAELGIDEPTTWDELVDAAETVDAAGIIPFSADGADGWPLTRLVGNYIYRTVGPDALQKVADGEASLTDPEYVEAAAQVAALGEAGYFGPSVGSIDYMTAVNQFLTGKAAMFYMGSWILGNFNDPSANLIGNENIAFMPFPNGRGGRGRPHPARCERRRAARDVVEHLRREVEGVAELHRRELRFAVAAGTGCHLRLRHEHRGDRPAAAHAGRPGAHQRDRAERALVRGALQHQGRHDQPDQCCAARDRIALARGLHVGRPGRPRLSNSPASGSREVAGPRAPPRSKAHP